jgi:protein-S-isoprenylcysteine O-methyltransferase Ste14
MSQNFFHFSFVILFIIFIFIRIYYHKIAVKNRGKFEFKEGKLHIAFRIIFGIPLVIILITYMFKPSLLVWAEFDLPEWIQWIGFIMGITSIPLLVWVHNALGINFSGILHIRDEHTLVTNGPYKYIRHPMYTVFYIFEISILFLTKNLFLGSIFLILQTVVVAARIKKEEAVMIEKFGDSYLEYMKHTGRFLPYLRFL